MMRNGVDNFFLEIESYVKGVILFCMSALIDILMMMLFATKAQPWESVAEGILDRVGCISMFDHGGELQGIVIAMREGDVVSIF